MRKFAEWRFSVAVVFPVVAIAVLSCLGLAALLHQAVLKADMLAEQRQAATVRHAIERQIARIPHDQESVAIWDDAVLRTRARDLGWIHENLGQWMYEYFGHDRTYVVTDSGVILYAMRDGEPFAVDSPPDRIAAVRQFARMLRTGGTGFQPAGDSTSVPHLTEFASVAGRPAVVSAMAIVPHSDREALESDEPNVFVSVQFLDRHFISEIADGLMLKDAAFREDVADDPGPGAIVLRNARGEGIGTITWTPDRPGSQIMTAILPAGLLVLCILALAGCLALRRLRVASLELETSRAQARHLAFHDQLTGLPNRPRLIDGLERAIATTTSEAGTGALLLLDLDRFKNVNDTHGHQAGDELICEFGRRLSGLLNGEDSLARLGGDEFAIVVPRLAGPDELETLCDSILRATASPFSLSGGRAVMSVSIGAAEIDGTIDRHELLRRADIALYAAKHAGRNCARVFAPEMDSRIRQRHFIEQELRQALDTGCGLDVHFQPKVDAQSGEVVGVEALARWRHERLGAISPSVFIPVAEECGLVGRLDEWVLRRATRAALAWPGVRLAVNVSAEAFREEGMAAGILETLGETGFPPGRLEVEITETVVMAITEETARELRTLRSAGVRIALDDFGTGYSSLNHLTRLHVDRIKIDRSFVQHLGEASDSSVVIKAVVRLGHKIGLSVTAEGVETEAQREFLRSIGCDEMQGYLFAAPMPADEVAGLLEKSPEIFVA